MPSLAETWRLIRQREAVDVVPAHLERRYGIRVANVTQLDAGVYRIDRHDGPGWIARLFPSVRPLERTEGDAEVLRFLETHGFPAERLAHAEPVSMHERQALLVTTLVEGKQLSDRSESTFRSLGDLLGRLHALPEGSGGVSRKGGAIHSFTLGEGCIRDEIADARSWLAEADVPAASRASVEALVDRMSGVDFGDDLP